MVSKLFLFIINFVEFNFALIIELNLIFKNIINFKLVLNLFQCALFIFFINKLLLKINGLFLILLLLIKVIKVYI